MKRRHRAKTYRIPCTQCDKTFSKTEHLNRHSLSHTGERPYKCLICMKQYARRDILLRHQRNHNPNEQIKSASTQSHPPYALDNTSAQIADYRTSPVGQNHGGPALSCGSEVPYPIPAIAEPGYDNMSSSATDLSHILFDASFETLPPSVLLNDMPNMYPAETRGWGIQAGDHGFNHEDILSPTLSSYAGVGDKLQAMWYPDSYATKPSNFWQEIAYMSSHNIFSNSIMGDLPSGFEIPMYTPTSELHISKSSKERIRKLKRKLLVCGCGEYYDGMNCGSSYFCINSMDGIEQGLYHYAHKYQPSYPILHPATFSDETVSELLLFVMCMIGVSFFKTDEAVSFIRRVYPSILNEAYAQLIPATAQSKAVTDILSHLVLVHHVLFLFISTGGNLEPQKSKILHLHAISIAQNYGLFNTDLDLTYESLALHHQEESARWQAWSRVESTKNLIIGLVLHDSWLSELFSTDPIMRLDSLILPIPCESRLYQSPNSRLWSQIFQPNYHTNQCLKINTHDFHLPVIKGPMHAFSMYGLLISVLLRVSGDIRRLTLYSDLSPLGEDHHVPWEACRLDKRADIAAPLVTSIINSFDSILQTLNPNCTVIWHCVCIRLTVDIELLSQAAGRDGSGAMTVARQALASWTRTSSARRACLHAAQTFRILLHRKPADGTAFQSVRTLFVSALVLGFYVLLTTTMSLPENSIGLEDFDLVDSDINWILVGSRAISDSMSDLVPAESIASTDAAIRFIEAGGPIVLNGENYQPGATCARRVFLEFAGLLDEVGSHWMEGYAQLLYTIHDTIVDLPTM